MSSIEAVEQALALSRVRLREAPQFEIFISTVAHLEYLLSVLCGHDAFFSIPLSATIEK